MVKEEIHALSAIPRSPWKLSHLHTPLEHLEPDVEAGCNHNTEEMGAKTRRRGIWGPRSDIGKHFLK